jgi:glutamate formiminotransferase/formiminotetrahydrofolate cyclodeaminase
MSKHKGEHPRMGATDVCPFIPISGISMEETVAYSKQLAKKVGEELGISVFLYEYSASDPRWKNLANIRAGEYEKMASKLSGNDFIPDFGPRTLNAKSGVTAIGARDFLIAYNVNLNTTSERRANSVAFDVREAGRIKTENGKNVLDANGEAVRIPGIFKGVKGIGWYIAEYGVAQVSMNITNMQVAPLHEVFEACCKSADKRGMRVTGSELVGLVPLQVMIDAGKFFLRKQERSVGVAESELIKIAIKSMGLDELAPFDPKKRIIEYMLQDDSKAPLVNMSLSAFADETASESMAPGGGSIAAYVGALGVSLGTMVANLSSHKKGWDERWAEFGNWAEKGQELKTALLKMVDEDTNSFNAIIDAMRLPKATDEEKAARALAIEHTTKYAVEVPLKVMQLSLQTFEIIEAMAKIGNPNSVTDAGVGALCARAAVLGAYLNVKVNLGGLKDENFVKETLQLADGLVKLANESEKAVLDIVHSKL